MSTRAHLQASTPQPASGRSLPSARGFEEAVEEAASAKARTQLSGSGEAGSGSSSGSGGSGSGTGAGTGSVGGGAPGAGASGSGQPVAFGWDAWQAPIQRLSIPGLMESAVRLHPGARKKLDAFTDNRRVKQVRAVLGNLGLAGGIRGKEARYAFKSQVKAEHKWNKLFGRDQDEGGGKEESSKAQCCADGASPFPANRHDASKHEAPSNASSADLTDDQTEPMDTSAQGAPANDPPAEVSPAIVADTTGADGEKLSDAQRARHKSEARRIFDSRRATTRTVAEIRASSAARHARRQERIGSIGKSSGTHRATAREKIASRRAAKLAGSNIGMPGENERMSSFLRSSVRSNPAMGAVNRRSIMERATADMGARRAGKLESHMRRAGGHGRALQGMADHHDAESQAEAVGDFFAMAGE